MFFVVSQAAAAPPPPEGRHSCVDSRGRNQPHGADFTIGCEMKCICDNGAIRCVSLCPPALPRPGCEMQLFPGRCCPEEVCK